MSLLLLAFGVLYACCAGWFMWMQFGMTPETFRDAQARDFSRRRLWAPTLCTSAAFGAFMAAISDTDRLLKGLGATLLSCLALMLSTAVVRPMLRGLLALGARRR